MYGDDNVVLREIKKESLMKNTVDVVISSVLKEAVDFETSPVIAINASGRKNFTSVVQLLGRCVRKNQSFKQFRCYIDFIDDIHPKLLEHSNERIQACTDIGAEAVICDSIEELLRSVINYYKEVGK